MSFYKKSFRKRRRFNQKNTNNLSSASNDIAKQRNKAYSRVSKGKI